MAVVSHPDGGLATAAPASGWPAGLVVALAVHAGVAAVLLKVDPGRFAGREAPVELDVVDPAPPPAPAEVAPSPRPPPAPAPVRRVIAAPKVATPPPEAPPPNQEPPPNTPPAPPVFGMTENATVAGDSAMMVTVGNTLATNDRTPAPPGPAPRPLPAGGAPSFVPVADIYIATRAHILFEVNGQEIYPADARRMGVSGVVELRIGVDQNGDVKEAKTVSVKPAGYQFEDAAVAAIRKAKFAPARTSDGKAVASQINYRYTFSQPQ